MADREGESRARSAISPRRLRRGLQGRRKPIPYHGYYYRILTRQGAGAPGGAYDYLVKGKMIGGFALIAFRRIWQFRHHDLHGQSGRRVFEKDLGPKTAKLARSRSLRAGSGWSKTDTTFAGCGHCLPAKPRSLKLRTGLSLLAFSPEGHEYEPIARERATVLGVFSGKLERTPGSLTAWLCWWPRPCLRSV